MTLPFSHDAFLDVFGAYNTLLWPAVFLIWAATVTIVIAWFRGSNTSRRLLYLLLAVHWAWSGVIYHWVYFRSINPGATIFAIAFVVQAGVFVRLAMGSESRVASPRGIRGVVGGALVVYGLLYPFISLATGLEYPRLPLFAVPCPTTLVTAGILIAVGPVPRLVVVVPMLWAGLGSTAAFALGIKADLALAVVAVLLMLDLVAPTVLGQKTAAS